ncbi:MAG: amidohydrolase [Planctomycetota bacterium]
MSQISSRIWSDEEVERLIGWRRALHRHPELGYTEEKTSDLVAGILEQAGYAIRRGLAGTGVVGELGRGGRSLLIRADMDALPIQEVNEVDYRSENEGVMHACGHDGHVAMALLTAQRLAAKPTENGSVRMVFQPAEEGLGGAKKMIEEGVLGPEPPDAAIGIHLWNGLPVGEVVVRPGPLMASVDEFEIVIRGRGGHGAIPQQTVDAILVASHLVVAAQSIVSRNVDPFHPAVVTFGSLHAGKVFNIIAQEARLKGTVRTLDDAEWRAMPERLERIVAGVCATFGAEYSLDYHRTNRATVNEASFTGLVREVVEQVVGPEVRDDVQTMAGEDMSEFLDRVPGCFLLLGSANAARGLSSPHHSPTFDFDEACLPIGAEILTRVAERFLGPNE